MIADKKGLPEQETKNYSRKNGENDDANPEETVPFRAWLIFARRLYHSVLMEADLRTSVKDYSQNGICE